jgi:hypothetical protein
MINVQLTVIKIQKLQASALIDALIFCCLMKLSGRRFWFLSWSHIDSADAMTSDSFGRVAMFETKSQ